MLEGVLVVLHVVIVVIGVSKEVVVVAEDVLVREVHLWKPNLRRDTDLIDLLGIVGEGLADLVAEVGVGVLVSDDLNRGIDSYGAMVGGEHDPIAHLGDVLEEVVGRRVTELTLGQ